MPERVHLWARSGVYPSVPTRLIRRLGQSEARLIGESVAFTKIAPPTRRHDVVPCVRTASRPRDDVIDRLSRRRAVLTAVPVACEHGVASERHRATVGHSDKAVETDHRRHLDLHSLGSEHGVLGLEQRRLLVEHQYGCPPSRHHRKRLIRRIQNQGASHVPSSSCDRPLTPRRYHPRESSPLKCAWGPASMTGPSSGVKAPVRTPTCAVRCRLGGHGLSQSVTWQAVSAQPGSLPRVSFIEPTSELGPQLSQGGTRGRGWADRWKVGYPQTRLFHLSRVDCHLRNAHISNHDSGWDTGFPLVTACRTTLSRVISAAAQCCTSASLRRHLPR